MANSDTYSAASGKAIYAGRLGPVEWLPAPGSFGYVNQASGTGQYMSDVFDYGNPQPLLRDADGRAILDVWCSDCYCPGWGAMGGFAATGGGHNDRVNNAVFMYDIALQRWFRISDAEPLGIELKDDGVCFGNKSNVTDPGTVPDWVGDPPAFNNLWAEYWTDATRTAIKIGKRGPTHTYGCLKYIPPEAAGNTRGYLVIMGSFGFMTHRIDLDNPATGWDRCGNLFTDVMPTTKPPAYGCAIWDTQRNRLFCYPSNGGPQDNAIILNFPSKTVSVAGGNYLDSYYCIGRYAEADDKYLVMRSWDGNNYPRISICHPTSGAKHTATHSGEMPIGGFVTMEWDEERRRVVGWDGSTAKLWFGQAPADMMSGTWVWTSQTFISSVPVVPQSGVNPMYDRLHFDTNLQAFFVVTRVDGPVQCFKI